jgi:outer membrane protein
VLALTGQLGPPVPEQAQAPSPPLPEVTAQAAVPAGEQGELTPLTLPEVLRLGLQRDRSLRISRHDVGSAKAGETSAYGVYQPQIDLQANWSKFESARQGFSVGAAGATSNHDASLNVDQLLFDTGNGLYSIYQARQQAKAAEQRELETELTTARRICADFFAVLRAEALQRLSEQLLDQAVQQQDDAQTRLDNELGAKLDVTRAAVAVSNAQVEQTAARNQREDSLATLRKDLLLPPGTPLAISDAFPVPAIDTDLDEALATARAESPAIAAAQADRRARLHALTAAQLRRWPQLRVTGSFQRYLESSRDVSQEYSLGASVSFPLWDGQSSRAQAAAARHALERAREVALEAAEQAALEVEQSWLAYRDAVERLSASEAAVALAAGSLAQTEESFRLGAAGLLDVTDARTEYARAESNRIQARFDRDLAAIDLRVAMGRLPLELRGEEGADGE